MIKWTVKRDVEVVRSLLVREGDGAMVFDATIDDLRRACEAAGLVVDSEEAKEARRADTEACIYALTHQGDRPASVLAGIHSMQRRLRVMEDSRDAWKRAADQSRFILGAHGDESLVDCAHRTVREGDKVEAERDAAMAEVASLAASNVALTESRDAAVAERDDLRARLDKAERLHSEAEAQVACRSEMRNRIATLEADLAAARARVAELEAPIEGEPGPEQLDALWETARGGDHTRMLAIWRHGRRASLAELANLRYRIAELEAPMPGTTIAEIVDTFLSAERAYYKKNRFDHDAADRAGAIAVAERVRKERCLVARAVAGKVGFEVWGAVDGAWMVRIGGKDKTFVPAAEVPAELARMLTEVGA